MQDTNTMRSSCATSGYRVRRPLPLAPSSLGGILSFKVGGRRQGCELITVAVGVVLLEVGSVNESDVMVVPVNELETLTGVGSTVGEADDIASAVQRSHLINKGLVKVNGGLVARAAS